MLELELEEKVLSQVGAVRILWVVLQVELVYSVLVRE